MADTDKGAFKAPTLTERFMPNGSNLITITGVSGSGKTALLLDLATEAGDAEPIPFISLAHSEAEIRRRLANRSPGRTPKLQIHQGSTIDISYIESVAKPNTPIFLDGINHLEDFSRERGRNEEITSLCRRLKRLSRDIDAPVVQTAMLGDYGKTRNQRRYPFWGAGIRESSYIKEFSDHTTFLHREEIFAEFEQPPEDDLDAQAEWFSQMEAVHGKGQAYTFSHGMWRTSYLEYDQDEGWTFEPLSYLG